MFPEIPEEIITALESLYKDRCPEIHECERTIWMNAGAASVVKYLRAEFERQNSDESQTEEEDFIDVYIKT